MDAARFTRRDALIIIEGPDMVGKSTLVKALIEELHEGQNLQYVPLHLDRPKPGFIDYYHLGFESGVFDRFMMSEILYSIATSRKASISWEQFDLISGVLRYHKKAFRVILWSSNNKLFEDRHTDEELFDLTTCKFVNQLYIQNKHRADVTYDVAKGRLNPELLAKKVVDLYLLHINHLASLKGPDLL